MAGQDQQNPFLQIDAQEAVKNPFTQLDGPDPGTLNDFAHGIAHAPTSLGTMAGEAESFAGHAVHGLGALTNSDTLQALGDSLVSRGATNTAAAQTGNDAGNAQSIQGQQGGFIRRSAYGVGDTFGQMATVGGGGAAAGAATGAAIGSFAGGVGAIPGALVGAGLGWVIANVAALPSLMGLSQADKTFDAVQAKAVKDGASPQDAENKALGAGAATGVPTALAGAAAGMLGPLGKLATPLVEAVSKAAVGDIVQTALNTSIGTIAKGTAAAAVEGSVVNTGTTAAVQGIEQGYGVGDGPTARGLIDAAVQGAAATGLMHGAAATVGARAQVRSNDVLADPTADPDARSKAAIGAMGVIATKSPQVAQDFGLYAQNQILKGQPIEVGPDAMYTGFADAIRQQQSDQDAQAQQNARGPLGAAFPGFTPTGDEAAAVAPDYVTNPDVAPPTAPLDADERTTGGQFPTFVPTGAELAAATVPQSAPPSVTDTIRPILGAGSVDDAIAATEQSIARTQHWVPSPAASEGTPAAENLATDRVFYADQAQQAQQQMRQQAFDQVQVTGTPPVPENAFAQRQAQLAAQEQAQRDAAFARNESDQRTRQADQAPGVTVAQGFDDPAPPSALSGAMSAELTRLGNRNLNNLTTTQLGALAAHHPDEAVRDQAAQIATGRRNAAMIQDVTKNPANVSTVSANGDMMHGVAAPAEPEFSQERASSPAGTAAEAAGNGEPPVIAEANAGLRSGLQGAETTEPASAGPTAAPARSLADTVPELQPLKAAMDADARARGQMDSGTGLVPVDTKSLPETRETVDNGVAGATTLSQSDAGLLQKTAAIFGKKVVLFRQEGDTAGRSLDGAMLPSDSKTIYVNADASGAHHLVVVGHELAHQMQAEAPNLYRGMQDALMEHIGDGGQNGFYRYYMNRAGMSDEQVRQAMADPGVRQRMTDEFIADLVGNRFGEYRTWQQVFADAAGPKADRSLVYRIADFITSFIDRLMGNVGFRKFATDDMVNNLTGVRTQVRRALAEYATQAGSRPMQHEAEQLRAKQANRKEGTQPVQAQLVEPVKAEPRADVGKEPSRAAPAPVAAREPEPSQGTQRMEPVGTPRTERVAESPERFSQPVARFDTRAEPATEATPPKRFGEPVARFGQLATDHAIEPPERNPATEAEQQPPASETKPEDAESKQPAGETQETAEGTAAGQSEVPKRGDFTPDWMDSDTSGLAERAKRVAYADDAERLSNLAESVPGHEVPETARGDTVKVYRAVDSEQGAVRPGDEVFLSRADAAQAGGRVLEETVPTSDVLKDEKDGSYHYAPEGLAQDGETATSMLNRLGADRFDNRGIEPEETGPEAARANPLSSDPQVRASGERALFLGRLDAAQEAAARAVGAITQKESYADRIRAMRQDLGKKLTQGIADQFYPIRELDSEAYMQTRLSKGAENGGLEAMMLYGKPFLRDGVLDVNVHDTGFAKVLSSLEGEHGRFFLWVAAQRAEQLKAQGKENLFTDSDISALKTLDQSDAQHPQRQQKFAAALKDLNDFNDSVLKIAEDSGLLDPATRQLFKDQPYVPFYRTMDGDGMRGPGKTSGLVNQYAFKKLKGGTNRLNQDLLANTMANWATCSAPLHAIAPPS